MNQEYDIISCQGFEYECELGFHNYEQGIRQKISLNLETYVSPINKVDQDKVKALRFDYFEANKLIQIFLKEKRFNLIETVADEVAQLLLEKFNIKGIEVCVTKFPLDMPNTKNVSYKCLRKKQSVK